ncbi:class I SAM-dependent methyltransferase [bacterium]|nr:class I SAM-dependent methyltransferase [bacterium]
MKKSLFDHSLSFVFRHIKDTEIMAQNMRSPKHFIFGYIAKRIMLFGNQKVIEDSVARLSISDDDVVIEIGSGNGQALLEIEKKKPSKIYAVEISEDFRKDLFSRFNSAKITITGNDAANLASIVPDKSIDKAILINVIYFLDPLDTYLEELKRILKTSGVVIIAGKFGLAQGFDPKIFKNTDIQKIMPALEKHFVVTSTYVDLGDESSRYHAIKLTRK